MKQLDEALVCDWLVSLGYTEDGDPIIAECGAEVLDHGRSWSCEVGHGGTYYSVITPEEELEELSRLES